MEGGGDHRGNWRRKSGSEEKEDHERLKLQNLQTQVEVRWRGPYPWHWANPFQFLKNQKSKHKSEWVGIGRVRSITIWASGI